MIEVKQSPYVKSKWAIFRDGKELPGPDGNPHKYAYYDTKREALSVLEDKPWERPQRSGNGGFQRMMPKGPAKDGLIFSALKGAAVLMALLYLSRIPQQPVEYDLTKYVPPRREW